MEEDPSLAGELKGQVFLTVADETTFAEDIANPERTFVQNTTCATCHRLTNIRFDFHTFSYFEERIDATISPRVVEDVKFDLALMQKYVDNLTDSE